MAVAYRAIMTRPDAVACFAQRVAMQGLAVALLHFRPAVAVTIGGRA